MPGSHNLTKNDRLNLKLLAKSTHKVNGLLLTIKEGDGIGADGVQSYHLFTVFGAAAFVFRFPPEKGSAGCCRESLTGIFLHFCHTVSAIKLLVHPMSHK